MSLSLLVSLALLRTSVLYGARLVYATPATPLAAERTARAMLPMMPIFDLFRLAAPDMPR